MDMNNQKIKRFLEVLPEHILMNRRNKTALGMSYTVARQEKMGKRSSNAAKMSTLHLQVHGTLDSLRRSMFGNAMHSTCKCCGHKTGKLVLNDRGRKKLKRMKERQNA